MNPSIRIMQQVILKRNWIIHATFWLLYLVLLAWSFSEIRGYENFLAKSIFIVLVQTLVFYLNFHVLLPRFFEKKKHLMYGLAVVGTILISLLVFYAFDRISFDLELKRAMQTNDFSRLPREFRGHGRAAHFPPWAVPWRFNFIWRSLLFYGFFLFIALFISTVYRNLLVNQEKEKESLRLQGMIREAESSLLKSQINPHFLFNTLNNIYSMAQLKSDQTADAVHRLSEMLRYVIYECNQPQVRLGSETSYIRSYIELQMLKDEETGNIDYALEPVDEELMIAPMLLIPFIENSFKHSFIEDKEQSWIRIRLRTEGNTLFLSAGNSVPAGPARKDGTGGVGLANVQKRLQLLYPGKHQLVIDRDTDEFKIELTLTLDENQVPDRR